MMVLFSQICLRGRDEMKLLISLKMMIMMMQMILTVVRNVAVTGRQSRDGDMDWTMERFLQGSDRCHISGASS